MHKEDEPALFPKEAGILQCLQKMMKICYQSAVASSVYFPVVCWGSSIRDRLTKPIRNAGSVIGCKPDTAVAAVVERRSQNTLLSITDHADHLLHRSADLLRSSFASMPIQKTFHTCKNSMTQAHIITPPSPGLTVGLRCLC